MPSSSPHPTPKLSTIPNKKLQFFYQLRDVSFMNGKVNLSMLIVDMNGRVKVAMDERTMFKKMIRIIW